MQQSTNGSKAYLFSIVLVAVLGGLLFGYDTAVISGAEKGLQAFFMGASDFTYTNTWHGFTCASAQIGCIIGSAISGLLATRLGRKRSLILAGMLFFVSALGSMEPEFVFFRHGEPSLTLLVVFNIYRIIGGIGVGIGAFLVALTFGNAAFQLVTMIAIMLYSASFMMSWGPICWVLIAEIFPNTIRGKAVAIAVAFQWIFNWLVSSTFVPMFNMHLTEGDDFGHWFTYGLYGTICVIAALFVWRLVPETKGKTLEDMSRLWRK